MSDVTTSPWERTLAGKPAVGAAAGRSRPTSMADVEAFTAMGPGSGAA